MMESVKAWGLGQSFNTPTDLVLGSLCLLLFAILFRMAHLVFRPRCAVCNKRRWFWQMTSIVTPGSGPETCEVAFVCRHIPSCRN